MRILHTSDWHLGARLGNQDRLNDQIDRLKEICDHIDREEVDLLLVAGDVFEEHRTESLGRILGPLAHLLTPRIEAGLTCVFLAGNHDREHVFPLLSNLQQLVASKNASRVIFAQHPRLVPIVGRTGEHLSLMLLPYPTAYRYDLADERWPSPDVKRQALAAAVRQQIEELSTEARRDYPHQPIVLSGHFLVRGIREGLYQTTEQEDVPLEAGDLPAYAYTALGHIHKPQAVGSQSIRYSGSMERMDLGEQRDQKLVLLVEVGATGLHSMQELPLNATPFEHFTVSSEDELQRCADGMSERDRTLVSLTLKVRRDQSLMALQTRGRELFPRLYKTPEPNWLDAPTSPLAHMDGLNEQDVAGTVRSYLQGRLRDDAEADVLMELAEELLAEVEVSPL